MRIFSFILLFIFSYNVSGQTIEDVLMQYEKTLKETEQFHCKMSYKLYEDHATSVLLEELKGISAKDKDHYYTKIGPTEFLFSPDITLKISNSEKVMAIAESSNTHSILDLDITSKILENFSSKKLSEKEKYWICDFSGLKNNTTKYNRIVLHISKSSHQITKQILYFSTPLQHGYKDKKQYQKNQRLEISFSDFKDEKEYSKNIFKVDNYMSLVDSKYEPKPKYSGYSIIDARNNTITN